MTEPKKVRVNRVRMVPGEFHTHVLLCPRCRKKFKGIFPEGPEYEAWREKVGAPPRDPSPTCPRCQIKEQMAQGWRWIPFKNARGWNFVPPDHPDAPNGLDYIPGPNDE